ncbi:ABC transporter ATP-binding protein [Luteibacter anthropi]|uniref:ABC transporter ATP-binding protein n=1 Tax=Luteibacter anthropi TaxID=564369 RepID=A0A7X5UBH9_9GAMM|nr:ABC transporter ATP-binding protein [Luteibacter anthropi]NII07451.1 ABC transporter ATP-binding protein [Luteibacter anthropi]URX61190.1 ABC transporter ATP-binding protein [Luteibacter anthropi]
MNESLRIDRLGIAFRGKVVFDGLSHVFPVGCHLIQGANGTGKSSLLGAMAGHVPYTGRIAIDGHDLAHDGEKARRSLAYVPDEPTFYPFVTGRAFVDFVLRTHRRSVISEKRCFDDMVGRLGLREHLDTRFGEASLGTRRKFFLLAAFLLSPGVILLDEPFNGLDAAAAEEVLGWLHDAAQMQTILLTCHQLPSQAVLEASRWILGQIPHTTLAVS